MANTRGLLARLTWFCFWPIEGQWRASVSMPRHNVSQKQHGWKERPPQRLSIRGGAACMHSHRPRHMHAQRHTHTHTQTHHDAWAWVRTDNLATDGGGGGASTRRWDHAHSRTLTSVESLTAPLHYTTLSLHSHEHTTSAPLWSRTMRSSMHTCTHTSRAPSGQYQAKKHTHTHTHTSHTHTPLQCQDIHTSLSHKEGGGDGLERPLLHL